MGHYSWNNKRNKGSYETIERNKEGKYDIKIIRNKEENRLCWENKRRDSLETEKARRQRQWQNEILYGVPNSTGSKVHSQGP